MAGSEVDMSASMAFDTPKSSMTTRVAYNPEHKVLSLTFRNGGQTHHYADVPLEHYHGLHSAESTGKYFHQHIRDKFKAAR